MADETYKIAENQDGQPRTYKSIDVTFTSKKIMTLSGLKSQLTNVNHQIDKFTAKKAELEAQIVKVEEVLDA